MPELQQICLGKPGGGVSAAAPAARRLALLAMIANVTPLASVRVDFNFSDPCYVLQLVASDPARGGDAAVVAALSNHALKLFACGAGDLRHVADMTGHNGRITDVCMPRGAPSELAISSSEDGTVRCWDLRSQAECERCSPLPPPAMRLPIPQTRSCPVYGICRAGHDCDEHSEQAKHAVSV